MHLTAQQYQQTGAAARINTQKYHESWHRFPVNKSED